MSHALVSCELFQCQHADHARWRMSRNGAFILVGSRRRVHGDCDGLPGLDHLREDIEIRNGEIVHRRALVRDGDGDIGVRRAFERLGIEEDVVGGHFKRIRCSCR